MIQLRVLPPNLCTRMPQDEVKMEILRGEAGALLHKKAIKEVTTLHAKRVFLINIVLVQKRSGGWRPVIDLSCLHMLFSALISK